MSAHPAGQNPRLPQQAAAEDQAQDKTCDTASALERAEGAGKLRVSEEPEGDRKAKARREGGDSGRRG